MTITVANRQVQRLGSVSDHCRLALSFVDGGLHWLDWAILDPQARYHFADETRLVESVQEGLHATNLTLLPKTGLLVSPIKLMTFGSSDLRLLAQIEDGTEPPSNAAKMLAAHRLVTAAELAGVETFLAACEVRHAPVFADATLMDRLAILALARSPQGRTGLRGEAARFAVDQGRTPLEFVDYFQIYLLVAAETKSAGAAGDRAVATQQLLHTLLPMLFGALDCPRVDGLVAPWEVAAAIGEWLMMGRRVGFSRLSEGARQIVAHAGLRHETGHAARRLVETYLDEAQALLGAAELGRGRVGQDGRSCLFPVKSDAAKATVALGPGGIVTLASFVRAKRHPHLGDEAADDRPGPKSGHDQHDHDQHEAPEEP